MPCGNCCEGVASSGLSFRKHQTRHPPRHSVYWLACVDSATETFITGVVAMLGPLRVTERHRDRRVPPARTGIFALGNAGRRRGLAAAGGALPRPHHAPACAQAAVYRHPSALGDWPGGGGDAAGRAHIHARRDPLERCLACYRQLFALGEHHSLNQDRVASYWHDYDRTGRHWRELFPDRVVDYTRGSWHARPDVSLQRLREVRGFEDWDCVALSRAQHVQYTAVAPSAGRRAGYDAIGPLRPTAEPAARLLAGAASPQA